MVVIVTAFVLMIVLAVVVIGSVEMLLVIELSRQTTASRERIWRQWAEVSNRMAWDGALESIRLDGPFQVGSSGVGKLKERGRAARFTITAVQPYHSNTERFLLPFFNRMDWHHSITDAGDGRREVTFRVEVKGPGALILKPVLARILRRELPPAMDRLVDIAERDR